MYKVAVCDDEDIIREDLCTLCSEVLNFKRIEYSLSSFNSAEALEHAVETGNVFDIIILDIELSGKSDIDLAQEMRRRNDMTSIIFVSSHEGYLRYGYNIQPIHFLIKPVNFNMLYNAISADIRINHSNSQILFNFKNKTYTINTSDITFIEIIGHSLYIHTEEGKTAFRRTMAEVEQMLPGEFFADVITATLSI